MDYNKLNNRKWKCFERTQDRLKEGLKLKEDLDWFGIKPVETKDFITIAPGVEREVVATPPKSIKDAWERLADYCKPIEYKLYCHRCGEYIRTDYHPHNVLVDYWHIYCDICEPIVQKEKEEAELCFS